MKCYPKQSVCPHCGAIYRYTDMKGLMWKKQAACYHCHREFAVKRRGIMILTLEMLAVYALLNLILIGAVRGVSLIGMFIINMIPALAAILLMPAYVELRKIKK